MMVFVVVFVLSWIGGRAGGCGACLCLGRGGRRDLGAPLTKNKKEKGCWLYRS